MIPTLAFPGERMPGQLGPIRRVPGCSRFRVRYTRSSSCAGMPSVIATTRLTPLAAASRIELAAKRGGTKIIAVFGETSAEACVRLATPGVPSASWPALRGVTPPTTFVPYFLLLSVWNEPSLPVIPATARRVRSSTRTAISSAPPRAGGRTLPSGPRSHSLGCREAPARLGGLFPRARRMHVRQRGLLQEPAPLDVVGPIQAHDERDGRPDL